MAKEKTVYVCSNCGQESPKWVGKCPSCGEWNTYVEEIIRKEPANRRPVSGIETAKAKPVTLSEIEADDEAANRASENRPLYSKPYYVCPKDEFCIFPVKKVPGN